VFVKCRSSLKEAARQREAASSSKRRKRSLPSLEFRPTTTRHSCSRAEACIKLDAVGLGFFLLFLLLNVLSGVLLLSNDAVCSVGGLN
jgi:hypothetical protein